VTLTASSDAATITTPVLPLTLQSGQSSQPFQLDFKPTAVGSSFGAVLVQTDLQQTPFGVFFQGTAPAKNSWTDHFTGGSSLAVDILWVMDIADLSERDTVGVAAQDFMAALINDGIDFQMGVTSSDVCGADPAENGRIVACPGCHIDGETPTILTAADATAATDLQTLMHLSGAKNETCAPGKQFFEAAEEAMVSGQGATYNGLNGFIRSGAALAVITVNGDNTDDGSTQTPQWYASKFLGVKGIAHPELFSWSYLNPSQYGGPGGHQPFNGLPRRVQEMLDLVGGEALDTTQTDWAQGLIDLWNALLLEYTTYPLSGTPDPASIQVYLDGPPPDQTGSGQSPGVLVPSTNTDNTVNWHYDAANNRLDLNPPVFSLALTDVLYVEYNLACP